MLSIRTLRRSTAFLALAIAGPLMPRATLAQEPVRVTPQGILVDFQDADLRLVIAALAEAGNLNVTHGDLPARRITLRLRQPVAQRDIPALLRSIAQSNGLTVTEEAGFLRIEAATPGLERPGAAPGGRQPAERQAELRLFVYQLKHARAARLAATLQALFGGRGVPAAIPGLSRPPLSERLRQQQIPPTDPSRPEVQPLPAAPEVTTQPSLPGALQGEVQIVPDETTNSLLVRAEAADWEVLRQTIVALDLRPLQVLIEVLIAEVRHTRDLQVGVSASAADKRADRNGDTSVELKGATTGDFIFKILRTGDVDVSVTLSALAARGDVRILSRPVIFAQNNQEARILVGSERPFVQVFRSLPTDAAVRDQVVQYRDVGTSLSILPTINPDGYVNLQLTQEVSTATAETQFGAPVISTREASTHVFMRDGQTAVIGGLIDRQRDNSRSGIPILSEIPGLGVLFGTTRRNTTNSELFLFLTPRIVATDEDLQRVRGALQERSDMFDRRALPPVQLTPQRTPQPPVQPPPQSPTQTPPRRP